MSRKSKFIMLTIVGSLLALTIILVISIYCLDRYNNKLISKNEAFIIAINDAGCSKDNVQYTKWELENEDGMYIYDIEFIENSIRYEYEIRSDNGEILSYDSEKITSIS